MYMLCHRGEDQPSFQMYDGTLRSRTQLIAQIKELREAGVHFRKLRQGSFTATTFPANTAFLLSGYNVFPEEQDGGGFRFRLAKDSSEDL